MDAHLSHHFCSVTGKFVMSFHQTGAQEGSGSRSPCEGCTRKAANAFSLTTTTSVAESASISTTASATVSAPSGPARINPIISVIDQTNGVELTLEEVKKINCLYMMLCIYDTKGGHHSTKSTETPCKRLFKNFNRTTGGTLENEYIIIPNNGLTPKMAEKLMFNRIPKQFFQKQQEDTDAHNVSDDDGDDDESEASDDSMNVFGTRTTRKKKKKHNPPAKNKSGQSSEWLIKYVTSLIYLSGILYLTIL